MRKVVRTGLWAARTLIGLNDRENRRREASVTMQSVRNYPGLRQRSEI